MENASLIEMLKKAISFAYEEGCRDTENGCQVSTVEAAEQLTKRFIDETDSSKLAPVNPMQLSRTTSEGVITIMSTEEAMTKGIAAVGKSCVRSK
ncbi:hypothetical protein [Vibrio coralliilyticus]|uniref:hypothetical protein n=1 Tax=Vibrio coralliilyticus TaxID=190893 RepID=UPI000BAC281C|nr:hypothetical protein [Vibrio coralliilyticus]PAW00414.1 hypothetical protein CKJ79_27115 [Vibrio coralliilyticus]